jgi:hypothetical protein
MWTHQLSTSVVIGVETCLYLKLDLIGLNCGEFHCGSEMEWLYCYWASSSLWERESISEPEGNPLGGALRNHMAQEFGDQSPDPLVLC